MTTKNQEAVEHENFKSWKIPTEPKVFQHSITAYLKDSNAYGNIYFSRYIEWQGVCREKWFHDCIFDNMFAMDGMFLTKETHQDYFNEAFPFQKIDCYLNVAKVRPCYFNILFRFCVDGVLVSSGYQKVVYVNKEKKIARIPVEILNRVKDYELSSAVPQDVHLGRSKSAQKSARDMQTLTAM